MKNFSSPQHMLEAHESMYGKPGRQFAELVIKHAATLFAVPLNALNIRVILAPVELGPYNRHSGWCAECTTGGIILANRHHVVLGRDGIHLVKDLPGVEDFIVHELTHQRQRMLLRENGWSQNRGHHRDLGWYHAIMEAAPKYLGVELTPEHLPLKSKRYGKTVVKVAREGAPTESEWTHWPSGLRFWAREQRQEQRDHNGRNDVKRATLPGKAERKGQLRAA